MLFLITLLGYKPQKPIHKTDIIYRIVIVVYFFAFILIIQYEHTDHSRNSFSDIKL